MTPRFTDYAVKLFCMDCKHYYEANPDLPRMVQGRLEVQQCPYCGSESSSYGSEE